MKSILERAKLVLQNHMMNLLITAQEYGVQSNNWRSEDWRESY